MTVSLSKVQLSNMEDTQSKINTVKFSYIAVRTVWPFARASRLLRAALNTVVWYLIHHGWDIRLELIIVTFNINSLVFLGLFSILTSNTAVKRRTRSSSPELDQHRLFHYTDYTTLHLFLFRCGHTFPSDSVRQWSNIVQSELSVIKMLTCH